MPYRKILAENLLDFRKLEGISQLEMSFRTGISKDTISLIERECTNVTLDVLEKIASYLGLTIPELFTDKFVKENLLLLGNYEEKI